MRPSKRVGGCTLGKEMSMADNSLRRSGQLFFLSIPTVISRLMAASFRPHCPTSRRSQQARSELDGQVEIDRAVYRAHTCPCCYTNIVAGTSSGRIHHY
jgi:hypothetical protein